MSGVSRTSKGIKNSYTALFYGVVTILLGLLSRRVFIDSLGVEIVGLNSTVINLLQFLNLAELGVGSAVAFSLYAPLARGDKATINEIVTVQGWLYRRIAYFIIGASTILCCFFPLIFKKMELPLWYAYASFAVVLFNAILGYFANYRQILLSASQQQYKIDHNYQGIRAIKLTVQIIGLSLLSLNYQFWLIVEVMATILTSILLNRSIRREFPLVKRSEVQGRELITKHKPILKRIKQLLFHKIGGFVLTQTSPLIIYALISLAVVAIYGNYMLLISGVLMLSTALNSGISAGVGNLVAQSSRDRVLLFFREYTSFRYCLATILSLSFMLLSNSFMRIWFGEEYLLDNLSTYLLVGYAFVLLVRTNDSFISAYALFGDIYAPLIEAALNLGLSIVLGYYFGLPGIISGVLISLIVVIFCWKPYYLFTRGFKEPFRVYIKLISKNLSLVAASVTICLLLFPYIFSYQSYIYGWLMQAFKLFCVCSVVTISVFQIFSSDFRLFTTRIANIVKSKL